MIIAAERMTFLMDHSILKVTAAPEWRQLDRKNGAGALFSVASGGYTARHAPHRT
jgi:hypothetical protein